MWLHQVSIYFKGCISKKRIRSLHFLITFTKYIPIRMLLMWLVLDVSQICQCTSFPLVLVDTLLNMFIIQWCSFVRMYWMAFVKKVECAAMSLTVHYTDFICCFPACCGSCNRCCCICLSRVPCASLIASFILAIGFTGFALGLSEGVKNLNIFLKMDIV